MLPPPVRAVVLRYTSLLCAKIGKLVELFASDPIWWMKKPHFARSWWDSKIRALVSICAMRHTQDHTHRKRTIPLFSAARPKKAVAHSVHFICSICTLYVGVAFCYVYFDTGRVHVPSTQVLSAQVHQVPTEIDALFATVRSRCYSQQAHKGETHLSKKLSKVQHQH